MVVHLDRQQAADSRAARERDTQGPDGGLALEASVLVRADTVTHGAPLLGQCQAGGDLHEAPVASRRRARVLLDALQRRDATRVPRLPSALAQPRERLMPF